MQQSTSARGFLEVLESRRLLTASVYTVDLTSDTGASTGPSAGDLLYCLNQANDDSNPDGSEIQFDPSVFNATTPQTITLTNTLFLTESPGPEVVVGPGSTVLTISGGNAVDVLVVGYGTSAGISGLTISNGSGGDGAGIYIASSGSLSITDQSIVTGNSGSLGGGIANQGSLTIDDSTISDNTGETGGGIVDFENSTCTIEDGSQISGNTGGNEGGGILNAGTLLVENSTIGGSAAGQGNSAELGGGISSWNGAGTITLTGSTVTGNMGVVYQGGVGEGGGLLTSTPLYLTNTVVSYNSANYGGGICNQGQLTISDSTIQDNTANRGAGISNELGSATINNGSVISGNTAHVTGGGIYNYIGLTITGGSQVTDNTAALGDGGGIYNTSGSSLQVTGNSTISGNQAPDGRGGGVTNFGSVSAAFTDSTISGNTAIHGGGLYNSSTSPLTISGCIIDSNSASQEGGGISNSASSSITINGGTFSLNSSVVGGGLYNKPQASATITGTTLQQNTGTLGGGAIASGGQLTVGDCNFDRNSGSTGGAVLTEGGSASVTGSTFSNNQASYGGGGIMVNGGTLSLEGSTLANNVATYDGGAIDNGATVLVTNSTLASNTAGRGGGIYNDGTATTVNSTIAYNVVTDGFGSGGGIENLTAFGATLYNTIVTLNTDGTGQDAPGDDIGRNSLSASSAYNLIGVDTTATLTNGLNGNQVGVSNPGLGTLADNGGPTETIALLAGSPAIASGSTALAVDSSGNPLAYDQRGPGFPRTNVANGTVDIGAYQSQSTGQVSPQVTVNPVNLTYGTALDDTQLSGTATVLVSGSPVNVPGTFSFGSLAGTVLTAGAGQTETVTFTPTDTTDSQRVEAPVTVNVSQAQPDLSVNDVSVPEGTALDNSQLSGTATWVVGGSVVDVAGTFSYTTGLNTVPAPGANSESVTFTPSDSVDYTSATDQITVTEEPPAAVTVTLATSANFVAPGQRVIFTVTVSPPSGDDVTPTGVVTLNVNGASGTLVDGVATITTSFAAGLTSVTASYSTNSQFHGAVSNTVYELAGSNLAPQTSDHVSAAWSGASFTPAEPVTWSDGTTHYIGLDAFGTVQAGVDGVQSGGTVNVAPGTYTEQVTINQDVTLVGSGQGGSSSSVTIQAPSGASGDLITIANNADVQIDNLSLNDGTHSWTAIDAESGSVTAASLSVTGFSVGAVVDNNSTATITASAFSGDGTGIVLGSSSSDNSALTATGDSFTNDSVGVDSVQSGGSANVTLDWWGTATGPLNSGNAAGTGTPVIGNVAYSPWLGGSSAPNPQSLVFLAQAGSAFGVTPLTGDSSVSVTSSFGPALTVPGGDTVTFSGSGITVTIDGESGTGSTDDFIIMDNSVEYISSDGLNGTTVNFTGASVTRDVNALGGVNMFNIESAGTGGPYHLAGDAGVNSFSFAGNAALLGTITGAGSSTLDYAGYRSGVSVNLGNGTNGTGTGVLGAIQGINAIIGSAFGDSLNAGAVANVALTGGLGDNQLTGSAAGDTVVEQTASNVALSQFSLTAAGIDDILSGINSAQLTDTLGGNTFVVSGWTGTGSLSAPANRPDTVDATKRASFTLSNASLSSTDGMSLNLSGITDANLAATIATRTFTVSGWTGSASLTSPAGGGAGPGTQKVGGTVVAVKDGSFNLSNTSLSSSDGMALTLSGFTIAKLTDTGTGGNTVSITGWTGSASLVGPGDTLDDVVLGSTTLTNTSLSVGVLPKVTLSGFTAANLTDISTGGISFTVSGWTGSGSLNDADIGGSFDAVDAAKSAGYTLSNTALTSTDGMSLALTNITSASLTDNGSGGNTFDVSGWNQVAALADTGSVADTVDATKAASFRLSNSTLESTDGMIVTMSGIGTANLTATIGSQTFTVSSWTGNGSLTGGVDGGLFGFGVSGQVIASKSANFTLSNSSLNTNDGMSLNLSGITSAILTSTVARTFTVSGWTGGGSLTSAEGGGVVPGTQKVGGTVVAAKDGSFNLSNTSLSSSDGMGLTLSGFTAAKLTDTGTGGNTVSITGWTGSASLVGPGDTLDDVVIGNTTLTNTSLSVSGLPRVTLSGFTAANLTDSNTGGISFIVSGWTGSGSLEDSDAGGSSDALDATKSAGYTLSNTALTSTDGMSLALTNITSASLTDNGSGGNTFNVSGWTEAGSLADTGGGSDTVDATKAASFRLSNAALESTDGLIMSMSGIGTANLTATIGSQTFTVSSWTGNGSLTGGVDSGLFGFGVSGQVIASKGVNFTLSNSSLSTSDGMSLNLNGITSAILTATVARTFTVSGWTGGGSLTSAEGGGVVPGTQKVGGTVVAVKDGSFNLSNTSLSSSDGMGLTLTGFTTAKLTDTGTGGNTVSITGWTGSASLVGPGGTLDDVVIGNTTLTNTSLSVSGLPKVTLSGFAAANLTDSTTGGISFTVSGWTGSGSLDDADAGGSSDAVGATKSAGYTLSNTALTSTDGMSLALTNITSASLTDNGSGGNTFDVSGWTEAGSLANTGSVADTVDATKASSFRLSNTTLESTDGMIVSLSGIGTANLASTIGSQTFTVSSWTGNGSLTGGLDSGLFGFGVSGQVIASKSVNFTLSNSSLSTSDGMSLNLNGITSAILTATVARTFTVSGWTGGGSLTSAEGGGVVPGTQKVGGTVVAVKDGSFNLSNTSLSSSDGMGLTLTGFTTAKLTDTGTGGNTVSITGWTGSASLVGPGDTLDDVVIGNTTLTNTSLSVSGLPKVTLSGFAAANLTDSTTGGISFTVSGWTGSGSLDDADAGGSSDAVDATKSAGYTLSNTALTSTDGMSLALTNITSAILADNGSGGNVFDVSGWSEAGSLADTGSVADTVDATKAASFKLSNTSLESTDGMIVSMSGIGTANLTATIGSQTFTVSSWTGNGSLTGGVDRGLFGFGVSGQVIASKSVNFTLSNSSLSTSDGMSLNLNGITSAILTATVARTFTVSGWTGGGSLTSAEGGGVVPGTQKVGGTVVAVKDGSFNLSNASLSSSDGMGLTLSGFTAAKLTDTGTGGNTIELNNWTGNGSLTAVSDTLNAVESGNVTLSNSTLKVGAASIQLAGITTANLSVTAGAGQTSYVVDASGFSAGPASVTVSGSANAIVFGGTGGNDALTIAAGATGNDILIGNGPFDSLTDNGNGRDILIGAGAGGDTLTGNGNDILVSGTTKYDSDTSANITALDAILAEWASSDSYSVRINQIMSGVGSRQVGFNSSTVSPDTNANVVSDSTDQLTNANWFIVSSQDTVNNEEGETESVI